MLLDAAGCRERERERHPLANYLVHWLVEERPRLITPWRGAANTREGGGMAAPTHRHTDTPTHYVDVEEVSLCRSF